MGGGAQRRGHGVDHLSIAFTATPIFKVVLTPKHRISAMRPVPNMLRQPPRLPRPLDVKGLVQPSSEAHCGESLHPASFAPQMEGVVFGLGVLSRTTPFYFPPPTMQRITRLWMS